MNAPITTNQIALTHASGAPLDPRRFSVRERMSALWTIDVMARSKDPGLDFDDIVGRETALTLRPRTPEERTWRGLCTHIEQLETEPGGLSTYQLTVVPHLWLASQRRNYRIFQHTSDPDIALRLLGEWGIEHRVDFDRGAHKPRKYRVQYAESDYAFLCRLLEDAGVSFYFDGASTMVLTESPHAAAPRPSLPYAASPEMPRGNHEFVTAVAFGRRVRPGAYAVQDLDYRRPPTFPLAAEARVDEPVEARLERYHYVPGAFLYGGGGGGASPVADDRGPTRTSMTEGQSLVARRLEAKRASARPVSFDTTALDVAPGTVVTIDHHPHPSLSDGASLLVVETELQGESNEEWRHHCDAVRASSPFRPPLATPKPKVQGVESATVVGGAGDEIHCDEFGRIRVHFHWDRESGMDERSSCWIPVSQPWSGTGFGGSNLPRVGQEVLVSFLGGDPDRPVVTGRVYTALNQTPYKLPDNKTKSGWRSMSSPGGGGFNEIMFEDAKGNEQLYMQAEKNMDVLVKNDQTSVVKRDQSLLVKRDRTKVVERDETTTIQRDRKELVENDELIVVKHDRTRLVENDETVTIQHDRMKTVEHDELITINHDRREFVANDEEVTIGNDRTHTVAANHREMVGENRARAVGANEIIQVGQSRTLVVEENHSVAVGGRENHHIREEHRLDVGGSQTVSVGDSQSLAVAKSQQVKVAMSANEQVGLSKSTQVGGTYSINVVGALSSSVGGMSTEQVGLMKNVTVGAAFTLTCGASSLTMDAAGNITLKGTAIVIDGATVKITGNPVELN